MEHLPHGDYPIQFKIPYICKSPYNHGGDWLAYPATQGFNLDHLRAHIFYHYPPDTVPPFLQSWLYFGLLFAILPFKPEVDDFLVEDEKNGIYITTSRLPSYFERWRQHAGGLPEQQRLSLWQKNVSILKEAHKSILLIGSWPDRGSLTAFPTPLVGREMTLSFALLGRALELANSEILNTGKFVGWRGVWETGSLLLEHMENMGWCPFLIAGFERSFSIDEKYYASTIGAPRVKRNHRACIDELCRYRSTGIQHVVPMCQCLIFSPDIDKMGEILARGNLPLLKFLADSDGGNGGKLEVVEGGDGMEYVAMSHVWSDGLGNFDANEMPACQLARIQAAVDAMYQDGLEVDQSDNCSVPFWMDTLLIPNDPELKDIKDATIVNMTQIYKNAKAALVIDSEVATCSVTSDSLTVLYRIVLSNWMRRLWTLQEAVFADSVYFLLSDGPISLRDLLSGSNDGIGIGIKTELSSYLVYRFKRALRQSGSLVSTQNSDDARYSQGGNTTIRAIESVEERILKFLCFEHCFQRKSVPKDPEIPRIDPSATERPVSARSEAQILWDWENAILRAIRSAADRVSTFASDEALCIALLLDIDPRPIISAKNELSRWEELEKAHPKNFLSPQAEYEKRKLQSQPMLQLFELLNGLIPPGIILVSGPRQQTSGFRWAPKSFLNGPARLQGIQGFPTSVPQGYSSEKYLDRFPSSLCRYGGGIRVTFPGIRLGKLKENLSLEKMFVVDTLQSPDPGAQEVTTIEGKPPRIWQVLYRNDSDDPAWATVQPNWQNSMSMGFIICSYTQSWPGNALTGLMVCIKCEVLEDDGVESFHVERICRVIISGVPEHDDMYWMKGPEQRISGSFLPMTQQWCID